MAARAGDASVASSSRDALHPPAPADTARERTRSASVTDGAVARSNSRIAQSLDALRAAAQLAPTRRRSSGGVSLVAGAQPATKGVLPGFGRRDSTRSSAKLALSTSSTSPAPPQLRTFESYNARNVAAALEPGADARQSDDVWQQVCIRVLPLFNGEGIRGFVEDLNELVLTHVQRTFARYQSRSRLSSSGNTPSLDLSSLVTGLVVADLTDLIRTGLTTLAHKLSPLAPAVPLSNDRLLSRLNEIWLFFFTGILPHLEAIFWVLRCDERLRAALGGAGEGAGRLRVRPRRDEGRIDVRRIALIEFRDNILHPEMDRLEPLFDYLYRSSAPGERDGAWTEDESRPNSRRPSLSVASPPTPPDIRRSHSQPHPPGGAAPARVLPAAGPQRQHSSPSRLSPDPNHLSAFPSPTFPSTSSSRLNTAPPTPSTPGPAPSPVITASSPATAQAFARRRQMVAVLASLLTADDRQSEMDALLRIIRPSSGSRYRPPPPSSRRGSSSAPQAAPPPETGYSTPVILGSGDDTVDGDEPGSGAATGLTASPTLLTEEPSSLSSAGGDGPLAPPVPFVGTGGVLDAPARVAPPDPLVGVERVISARQRSRTMDSLDEEDVFPPPLRPASALAGGARVRPPPPLLARASSDGASSFSPAQAAAAAAAAASGPSTKRRSFLPRLGRSNSQASSIISTSSFGGGEGSAPASEDDASSLSSSLHPATATGGGSSSLAGDKLRRGLLRRNSSRTAAADRQHSGGSGLGGLGKPPALGVAAGFAVEDDVLDVDGDL
ncbi:uncharacterized protein JCM10292_000527 [Rhodotorula paludigena]|uniref:uncharacterized protein n=1 Tax=Rhodotorula paludigena TaxID=86838 RepID=UPI00317DC487